MVSEVVPSGISGKEERRPEENVEYSEGKGTYFWCDVHPGVLQFDHQLHSPTQPSQHHIRNTKTSRQQARRRVNIKHSKEEKNERSMKTYLLDRTPEFAIER
jgi:hypothetical protein